MGNWRTFRVDHTSGPTLNRQLGTIPEIGRVSVIAGYQPVRLCAGTWALAVSAFVSWHLNSIISREVHILLAIHKCDGQKLTNFWSHSDYFLENLMVCPLFPALPTDQETPLCWIFFFNVLKKCVFNVLDGAVEEKTCLLYQGNHPTNLQPLKRF